jgi:cell wall-associated NlpC family hydrolase
LSLSEIPIHVAPELQQEVPEAFVRRRRSSVLSAAIVALVVPGLFATVAVPAYATQAPSPQARVSEQLQELKTVDAQTVAVSADAVLAPAARDAFTATTPEELAAAAAAAISTSYYLSNPPLPSGFSLDSVISTALQYQGVPYVFGGADPSGFDCSGFVMYVYAQYGVSLPHGSTSQGNAGTAIDPAAALPGDVIIMDGHDGFYMGNGMILDAPQEGGVVSVRPLWTDDYYIVRFGI